MKHQNLVVLAAIVGALGCGDESPVNPASPDGGAMSGDDAGGSADGDGGGDVDGDAGSDTEPDAGGGGDGAAPDGGNDDLPSPIEVECGGLSATECPVCANEATCDSPTYTDNGDGTVTSSCCGLVWQKNVEDVDRDWHAAYDYCESLSLSGGEYRLPSIAELQTLVEGNTPPTINTSVFPNTPVEAYWSSSAGEFFGAWEVAFSSGASQDGALTNSERVRCVRE
jgi:hypothetical protein